MSEFGKSLLGSLASGIGGGLGSLAGSLGSAFSGGLGQLFKSIQDKREHEYFTKRADYQQQLQHETMDKQQQQTIDFWNMQNEYNKPSAVAERYRNAGISPLSAFGGSVVGLGASSAPMPSAGSAYGAGSGGSALPAMDSPASVALAGSQIEKTGADIEHLSLTGKLVSEQIISQQLANHIEEINLQVKRLTADDSVELSHFEVEQKREDIRKTQQEIKESIQRVSESLARENLTNEQRELVQEQIVEQMLQNSLLEIKLKYADKLAIAEINNLNNQAAMYASQSDLNTALKELNNSYKLSEDQRREFEGLFRQAKEAEAKAAEALAKEDATGYAIWCHRISKATGAIGCLLGANINMNASHYTTGATSVERTTETTKRDNSGNRVTTTTAQKAVKRAITKKKK